MAKGQWATQVRDYAVKTYIAPARAMGKSTVKIRAGDVHKALNFTNRLPLVCSALHALGFRRDQNMKLVDIDGPGSSTTTTFTFSLQ